MKFLGIDVGTGGTRAVVVDTDGQVTASATVEHVPFASAQTGWAEQDPARLMARIDVGHPPGLSEREGRRHRGYWSFGTDAWRGAAECARRSATLFQSV